MSFSATPCRFCCIHVIIALPKPVLVGSHPPQAGKCLTFLLPWRKPVFDDRHVYEHESHYLLRILGWNRCTLPKVVSDLKMYTVVYSSRSDTILGNMFYEIWKDFGQHIARDLKGPVRLWAGMRGMSTTMYQRTCLDLAKVAQSRPTSKSESDTFVLFLTRGRSLTTG